MSLLTLTIRRCLIQWAPWEAVPVHEPILTRKLEFLVRCLINLSLFLVHYTFSRLV